MAGVSIDDFGASFIKYLPGVIKILSRTSKLRKIPLGTLKWQGEKIVKHLHVGYNMSWNSTVDGGAIKPAGRQKFVKLEATRRFHGGSVQVTDGIMANAKTSENSAVKVVESELRGLLELARRYEGYFFSRDGSGVVTTLGATVSGATITVADARAMLPGLEFEIRDAATPALIHATGKVKYVSRALDAQGEAVVTLENALPAAGQAQNDYIVWGTGEYSSYGRAIHGLDALIDDSLSIFQGVNCAEYPRWTSPVIDNGGAAHTIVPATIWNMLAMLKQESEAFEVPGGLLVYSNVWDGNTFAQMYENVVRVTPDSKAVGLAGGMTLKTPHGTVTVMTDPDVHYGKMLFINRKAITYLKQKELDWRKSEGGGIFQRSDKFYGFTASALEIGDLMIEERQSCGKIENLTVSPASAY
jgi:hypothetical protein